MKFFAALFRLGLYALLALALAFWWVAHEFTRPGPLAEMKPVVFARGTGGNAIANQLAAEGVIRSAHLFKVAAVLTGGASTFKAGEYDFPAGVSMSGVLRMLVDGDVVIRKITVPEGRTTREILAMVTAETALTGEVPAMVPEGALLPETYHFTYGDSRAEVVGRMKKAMDEAIEKLWPTRQENLPFTTVLEWVTLASIVERETGEKAERPRVAAVYVNRLRIHMPLQADPTVMYGIEQMNGKPLTRPLYSNDLMQATPYNTYVIQGLPPGPIANPGIESLKAAIQPLKTDELYFVATGTGGHRFAKSLVEHNANVRDYRAVMREQKQEPVASKEEAETPKSRKKKKAEK